MRHIGAMTADHKIDKRFHTALLSAVPAAGGNGHFVAATAEVCGIPLVSLQIRQLQALGFDHFLIETEQLSGAFLAAIDRLKEQGAAIDVIRSPQDLSEAIDAVENLLVIAPGLHVEQALLESLIAESDPLIATVDGRVENSEFELIDLNTRWAGIAIVGLPALKEVASLPEGWSLTSAILRSALHSQTKQIKIQQKELENKNIQVILDNKSIDSLTRKMLKAAGAVQSGLIESALYAPLANWAIMKLPFDLSWINIAAIIFSALALFTGFFGLLWIAAGSGILAVLLLVAAGNLLAFTNDRGDKLLSGISWSLLFSALLLACFEYDGTNAAFSALIVGLLLFYSGKLGSVPDRMRTLSSPALLTWALLLGAIFVQFNTVLQIFAILQLAELLYAQSGMLRKEQS